MPRFVPRERKHKRLRKEASQTNGADTNATEIVARPADAKQQLRPVTTAPPKISSAKRKRLDKYIETKLKKEENAELIRKLAEHTVDTSLFRSSKNLGRVRENQRERLQRALKEREILGIENDDILLETRRPIESGSQPPNIVPAADSVNSARRAGDTPTAQAGSGLKRPLEVDEHGKPMIRKRKRRKITTTQLLDEHQAPANSEAVSDEASGSDEDEWGGFSDDGESEDSSSDSPGDSEDDASIESDICSDGDVKDPEKPARISAFKAWANTQQNAAIGFTPSSMIDHDESQRKIKADFKPRAPSPDPLLDSIRTSNPASDRPADVITITRSAEVEKSRLELPVVQEEHKIMEAIRNNSVVIICGATGSGKTTQVPQMLFENGYGSMIGSTSTASSHQSQCMIGITQPRRVAATSVADRVAHELGDQYGRRVAHQVRYDSTVGRDTAIKFMTDGVLLREIQTDFVLEKYSCIVIDEAHERSVNTDILIGLLSRIVPLRQSLAVEQPDRFCTLKLVIMSATLRVKDFVENDRLFPRDKPPVVDIEGRQYAVTEHFARRTRRDFVAETAEKVARGHRKLPPGGILVFLTGQDEISTVHKSLKEKLSTSDSAVRNGGTEDGFDGYTIRNDDEEAFAEAKDDNSEDSDSEADITIAEEDEFAIEDETLNDSKTKSPLQAHILPLYAALPASQQRQVFEAPPDGHRMIILATNVAETSLTIPGIRYIFDCGRSKEKRYDRKTGVQTFEIDWICKASAAQRKGRAGRTGPGGHVWRLYSSAIYEQYFDEHTVPEILRTPLESVVLQLKGFDIENIAGFPFPTGPEQVQLVNAEKLLKNLGVITDDGVSEIGKSMLTLPLNPRLGKLLLLAKNNGVLQHAVALAASLAVGDLYIAEAQQRPVNIDESDDDHAEGADADRHQAYARARATLSKWDKQSDAIKLLRAVAMHADARTQGDAEVRKLCTEFWLREKNLMEVQQLRHQLYSIMAIQTAGNSSAYKAGLAAPSEKETKMLNQVVAAGFIDQVAIRTDTLKDGNMAFGRKPRSAIEVAYRTLTPTVAAGDVDRTASIVDQEFQRSVFIHPSSVLARLRPEDMPQYIVYSHLSQAAAATVDGKAKKTRMHPLVPVGPKALAGLAEGTPLLEIGRPIGKIEELPGRKRQCWVAVSLRAPESGGAEWPLTEWKVVQRKGNRGVWVLDEVISR